MKTNHYINLLSQAQKLYRHNRQGSYKTKERYFEAYKRFLHFLADTYRLEKIANISGKHLSDYVTQMQDKDYAPSTIKTDLAAIRFWHDQIPCVKYELPTNGAFDLKKRAFGEIDRRWSGAEYHKMIAQCQMEQRADFEACIILARYGGLRLHEVMRIDTAIARDALKTGLITIKGKGGKIRQVPIGQPIRLVLEKWIPLTAVGHKLFVPRDKQTHLQKAELQRFIALRRSLVQDAKSTRPMTFHGLRHTCAAAWYIALLAEGTRGSVARLQVSKWLGHEREDVTRIYLVGVKNQSLV